MLQTRKLGPRAILALIAALLLASCSTGGASPDSSDSNDALSMSPAADEMYRCLVDKGWDVSITWDGGIEASSDTVPDAQLTQYEADNRECMDLVDERIASMQPAEIEGVYSKEVATLDCLAEQGYEGSPPPSKQQYIDSFHAERWSAYGAVNIPFGDLSDEEWRSLNEACPQPAWSLGAR